MNTANNPTLTMRPIPGLGSAGIIVTVLVTIVLFGSLYWVTIPDGPWVVVVALQVLGLVFAGLLYVRFRSATIQIADGVVIERVFGNRLLRTRIEQIDRIALADVYVGTTVDTHLHLVALDSDGKRLFRIRSRYWQRDDIHSVAILLGVPVTAASRALTAKEFQESLAQA